MDTFNAKFDLLSCIHPHPETGVVGRKTKSPDPTPKAPLLGRKISSYYPHVVVKEAQVVQARWSENTLDGC